MGKWDKLRKELETTLSQMTVEDWEDWHANKQANRVLRQEVFQLEAEMHLMGMLLANSEYQDSFFQEKLEQQIAQSYLTDAHISFESASLDAKDFSHPRTDCIYALSA